MKKSQIFLFALIGCTSVSAQTNTFPSTGNVGIGTTNPSSNLHLLEDGNAVYLRGNSFRNSSGGFGILGYGAQGSESSPSALTAGDNTLWLRGMGFDGTNYHRVAHITFNAESVATGAVPGYIAFQTNEGNGVTDLVERMRISSNGNLGVGTTTPSAKLHVVGQNAHFFSNAATNTLEVGRYSNQKVSLKAEDNHFYFDWIQDSDGNGAHIMYFRNLAEGTSPDNDIRFQTSDTDRLTIKTDGSVGIGTIKPTAKFEILKNADLSSEISQPNSGLIIRADDDGYDASLRFGVDNANLKAVIQTQQTTTAAKFDLLINPFGGNVGIGTDAPGIYKLAVNGNVRAKEVRVETGWSDFVFESDYQLPTLEEVERHIRDKGHLQDIPSAEEVAKNGILLGEMDSKLLQKIEELMLYTIAQERRIQQLEKENEALHLLAERIEKIEARSNTK